MEATVLRLKVDSQTELVKKAIKMLNEAFSQINPKVIFCTSDEERGFDFEIKFVSKQKMISLAGKEALGYCDSLNRQIYILYDLNSIKNESELLSTIMHELLHAIGLSHIPEVHSLMYKEDRGVRGPTIYDVKALVRHLKLRKSTQEVR